MRVVKSPFEVIYTKDSVTKLANKILDLMETIIFLLTLYHYFTYSIMSAFTRL